MELNGILFGIVLGALCIILLGIVLARMRQPYIIAYILTGIILGPFVLNIITEDTVLTELETIGIILLMFFLGMEVSLPKLLARWRVAVLGTLAQILLTVGVVWIVAFFTQWSMAKVLLLGFAMSLSSTAVVVRMLELRKEHDTAIGQKVLGVLLVQDILIAPMIIIITLVGANTAPSTQEIALLGGGTILLGALITYFFSAKNVKFPAKILLKYKDLQLFVAALVCFGFALLTGIFGLSTALGAFIGGIYISSAKETHWVFEKLHSLHTVFIALFFVAIGTLIDLQFLQRNILTVIGLVVALLLTNTFINAATLRLLGGERQESMYFGALLAQSGEFSFVLAGTGILLGIITGAEYQLLILVIALSLLVSPIWVQLLTTISVRNQNTVS